MLQGDSNRRARLQVDTLLEEFRLDNRRAAEGLPCEIGKILSYVNEALFDSRLNVRVLKERCRISDNNVSSRFRYFIGLTIKEYIEELRLGAAELLLRESTIGIFEVAASVGYYHLQTFYRAFQRKHGCTPAEYRKALESSGTPAIENDFPPRNSQIDAVLGRSIVGFFLASQIMGSLAEVCAL